MTTATLHLPLGYLDRANRSAESAIDTAELRRATVDDLYAIARADGRPYVATGDDRDILAIWIDAQARSAAVLSAADTAETNELREIATFR